MPPDITVIRPKSRDYPSSLRNKKTHALFPQIWALRNLEILKKPLLGFFCSVKCPGGLIFRTYDLARSLRDTGISVIGGFHSPIEKDCLDLLIKGTQPMVLCPARGIQNMRLRRAFKEPIKNGRLCFLSPFEAKIGRPTIETSQRRNLFVAALSKAVFVSYAEPGGKTEAFCQEILLSKKPLYTFVSDYNNNLLKMGAKAVNTENVSEWASSFRFYNNGRKGGMSHGGE